MLLDLRRCDVETMEADVCIVGAGAAGLALAHGLLGSGLSLLVLESGGMEPEPGLEALNQGENIGSSLLDLAGSRRRVLGGATTLWAGQCVRMQAQDLCQRAWVAHSGWPLGIDELDPWYEAIESWLDIDGEYYDERNWTNFGIAPPALDPDRLASRFTVIPRRVKLGQTMLKALSRASDAHVLLHATTTGLILDDSGSRVRCLRAGALNGPSVEVRACHFVLSAGAIENVRLLLGSRDQQPSGIGNHHDQVGRFLQDHPNAIVGGVETAHPRYLQDRFALLYRRGRRYFPRMLLSPTVQRRDQVLAAAAVLIFEYPDGSGLGSARELALAVRSGRRPDRLGRRLGSVIADAPALATAAQRRFIRGRSPGSPPQRIRLQVFTEQEPSASSRVTLSRERDALGLPLAQVEWRISTVEGRTVEVMVSEVSRELARIGGGRVIPAEWIRHATDAPGEHLGDAFHHIGTTRMAEDPRHGVVNRDLRVHGVENLYAAGASTFPTSSWVNPTLTAMALSARLADHLVRRQGSSSGAKRA